MHGACYRKGNGQPYANTRHIKGKPQIKIAKFNSGNKKRQFEYCVQLKINEKVQIRHMALESTRLAANKTLEKKRTKSLSIASTVLYSIFFNISLIMFEHF